MTNLCKVSHYSDWISNAINHFNQVHQKSSTPSTEQDSMRKNYYCYGPLFLNGILKNTFLTQFPCNNSIFVLFKQGFSADFSPKIEHHSLNRDLTISKYIHHLTKYVYVSFWWVAWWEISCFLDKCVWNEYSNLMKIRK